MKLRFVSIVIAAALHAEDGLSRAAVQRYPYPPIASPSVSGDGRLVAFESLARLLPADTNLVSDVYLLDIDSGRLELVSLSGAGTAVNDSSWTARLSGDGGHVVFEALTPGPDAPCVTVFLQDRRRTTTHALATAWDDPSRAVCATRPAISSDGQWVAFESSAPDLVEGDENGSQSDVYLVNTQTGRALRVSIASDGTQSQAGSSYAASVSATGRHVAFTSTACLDRVPSHRPVVSGAGPCTPQVYVRDVVTGLTRGLWAPGGTPPNGSTYSPALSGDGRFVAFVSTATDLAPGDTNERPDVYVCDLASDSIELLSRTPTGGAGNGSSSRPTISHTGRFVAFDSTASDLISARRCAPRDRDHNLVSDVFLLDRQRGQIRRLSQESTGLPWWEPSIGPALDAAGRLVAFSSRHARDAGDVGADFDLFILRIRNE